MKSAQLQSLQHLERKKSEFVKELDTYLNPVIFEGENHEM